MTNMTMTEKIHKKICIQKGGCTMMWFPFERLENESGPAKWPDMEFQDEQKLISKVNQTFVLLEYL